MSVEAERMLALKYSLEQINNAVNTLNSKMPKEIFEAILYEMHRQNDLKEVELGLMTKESYKAKRRSL